MDATVSEQGRLTRMITGEPTPPSRAPERPSEFADTVPAIPVALAAAPADEPRGLDRDRRSRGT